MAAEKAKPVSTSKDTKETSVLSSIARHIPGLSSSSSSTATSSANATRARRSRKPKSQPMTTSASEEPKAGSATGAEGTEAAAEPLNADGLGEVEEKKTSAVEACHKRIRAANKKLQRIATYEEKTEALNADQQRAVASKPTLLAVIKELEELLVILKAEEVEDEARDRRNASLEEKKQARAIEVAVANAQSKTDSNVLVLFQFLHLHGLYTQQNQGFAPASLPPVVANATGQEVAAVRMLHDRFTNGPLLGGHGDAVESLNKIVNQSSEEALPGVPYSRIQELIAGLTSTPADATASSSTEAPLPESDAPAGPSDSVTALVDGTTDAPAPSFLNASELEQVPSAEEKVASWADEVEPVPATPSAVESTPTAATNGVAASQWADAEPAPAAPIPTDPWGSNAGATVDWATEDSGALPSLPELQPQRPPAAPAAAEAHVSQTPAPIVDADGFQPARPTRQQGGQSQQGGRGGGRGGSRGGERGARGGGSFRGRSEGQWTRGGGGGGAPRGEGATAVEGGAPSRGGRGSFRGGEGGRGRGGRGRGEGRGSFKGQNGERQAQAPGAAPGAAPAGERW